VDEGMPLHFTHEEYQARVNRTLAAMAEAGLDAMLCFKQESMYWLTGYDTFGYCFFQCLVLRADGEMVLLTRSPDLRQAQQTSTLHDIRVWIDRDGADPCADLGSLLAEKNLEGKRVGIEWDTHGLTAQNGMRLAVALDGFVIMKDASTLVSRLRLVKSEAELACVTKAAELADAALEAAIREARPGADEGHILAAMHRPIFEGGGDYPGNPFIIGSGEKALLCRYAAGRRVLEARDQLTLEFAGTYRQYHSCLMRTLLIGRADDEHRRMFDVCLEALKACEAQLRPGVSMGEVYMAHADAFDRHGMREHRLTACGYSLGAVYAPSWMDWPMFYAGNPVTIAPDMVFFLHMILANSATGHAMTLGRTSIVTEAGARPLSRHPAQLVVVS
jgi:Xaa-Pro dipeptidase